MSGILSKIQTIVSAHVNDAADKALQTSSGAREYARQLEDSLQELHNEQAVAQGRQRTLTREISEADSKINAVTSLIKQIQAGNSPNKDAICKAKAIEAVTAQKIKASKQSELEQNKLENAKLDAAVASLDAKHVEVLASVHHLEQLEHDTEAKEHAAAAMQHVGKVLSSASGVSVDNIAGKMAEKNDVASAKFDQAMNDLNTASDSDQNSDAEAFLASLK